MARSVMPSLRVVALVYTGLSAVGALILVVTAAIAPRAPVVQQVTEPARQVVTTLVQPTGDMITTLIVPAAPSTPAAPIVAAAPRPAPFVDTTSLDVTIDDVPAPAPVDQEPTYSAPPRQPLLAYVAPASAVENSAAEDVSSDDAPSADEAMALQPDAVAQPAEAPGVVMASVDSPKALPTLAPTPVPDTPAQVRARVDAENQAAIDAQKAAAAEARARADAANQAAIDAQKAPVMADSALSLPAPAAAKSADQTKLAAAKARADADAANQAAIDAAKAARPKR